MNRLTPNAAYKQLHRAAVMGGPEDKLKRMKKARLNDRTRLHSLTRMQSSYGYA